MKCPMNDIQDKIALNINGGFKGKKWTKKSEEGMIGEAKSWEKVNGEKLGAKE